MKRRVSKGKLAEFMGSCVSRTTTAHNTIGWYDAVVVDAGGNAYRVSTEALNPLADAEIEAISREEEDRLMRQIAVGSGC